jgi:hypothetical protein
MSRPVVVASATKLSLAGVSTTPAAPSWHRGQHAEPRLRLDHVNVGQAGGRQLLGDAIPALAGSGREGERK